ncbi:HNH endonuclease [Microbacterium sp. YY-01]|uniref:HNH endonuclease n=1 Tax=Microbacterium sp. YY-01 TaxID=3421634 RepID=UPI003D17DF1F
MAAKGFSTSTVHRIVARDRGACVRCGLLVAHLPRGVAWSVHHRRARGAGGTSVVWVNAASNGVVLCGSGTTGCHGWVESHQREAMTAGWVVSMNGRLRADEVVVRHRVLGVGYLTDDGGWVPVVEGPTPESWEGEAA